VAMWAHKMTDDALRRQIARLRNKLARPRLSSPSQDVARLWALQDELKKRGTREPEKSK